MIFLHFIDQNTEEHKKEAFLSQCRSRFPLISVSLFENLNHDLLLDDIIIVASPGLTRDSYFFLAILQVKLFFSDEDDGQAWLDSKSTELPKETVEIEGCALFDQIYCETKNPPVFSLDGSNRQLQVRDVDKLLSMAGQPHLEELIDSKKV